MQIKINVSGLAKSGKSTIIDIIHKALIDNGIINCAVENRDNEQRIELDKRIKSLINKNVKVIVTEKDANRLESVKC